MSINRFQSPFLQLLKLVWLSRGEEGMIYWDCIFNTRTDDRRVDTADVCFRNARAAEVEEDPGPDVKLPVDQGDMLWDVRTASEGESKKRHRVLAADFRIASRYVTRRFTIVRPTDTLKLSFKRVHTLTNEAGVSWYCQNHPGRKRAPCQKKISFTSFNLTTPLWIQSSTNFMEDWEGCLQLGSLGFPSHGGMLTALGRNSTSWLRSSSLIGERVTASALVLTLFRYRTCRKIITVG